MKAIWQKLLTFVFVMVFTAVATAQTNDPLPSWNEGASKQAIVQFVEDVSTRDGSGFIPSSERIAVFDNDGTLWAEQPLYFQLVFALDRVKTLAPMHPEWQEQQPFKAVLEDDLETVFSGGEETLLELIVTTHAGNTTEEFSQIVRDWLATAKHPQTKRPYTEMVYQPMLELLEYLRANDFKTYIASAGGIEFMRVFSEEVYNVPPEQVIGSSIKTQLELHDGKPVLVRLPEIDFIDDKADKPVGINQYIGRRPIAAFGNSDGDLQMLQWTTAGNGARLAGIVHHTDGDREWAYDRSSSIGRLDKALDEAQSEGWTIIDMKKDWKHIFPFSNK